jgi:hypothetical protein
MLKSTSLELLRRANPLSITDANVLVDAIDLYERVWSAIDVQRVPAATTSQNRKVRRAPVRVAALVGATLFVVLVVAPAFGLIRGVLPFFEAPRAPQPVRIEFESMNLGAPAGMSPQAIADNTREVGQFSFAGGLHTLWVAPTKLGGFCFEWIGGWGGCSAPNPDALSWNGDLELPAGIAAPAIPPRTGTTGTLPSSVAAAIRKARSLAVPTWISGYVNASNAQDIVIKFSDGTSVHPDIIWVSTPINAGFFSYNVPAGSRTEANHLVTVEALTASGAIVMAQPLRR